MTNDGGSLKMAILSFWSGDKKESGQTLSIVAIATHMCVEHNYKTLLVDATLADDTMMRCFWKPDANKELKKKLNKYLLIVGAIFLMNHYRIFCRVKLVYMVLLFLHGIGCMERI